MSDTKSPYSGIGGIPVPENKEVAVRSLVKKLCRIMKAVGYLQKTGENAAQKYKYATEADVAEMMREKLADENVFIFPNVVKNTRTRLERPDTYKPEQVK